MKKCVIPVNNGGYFILNQKSVNKITARIGEVDWITIEAVKQYMEVSDERTTRNI